MNYQLMRSWVFAPAGASVDADHPGPWSPFSQAKHWLESQVSIKWLANAVQSGRIRWVLVSGAGTGGGFQDGRIGASELMAAVQKAGTKVLTTNGGTLYDLSGKAAALLG